MLLIIITYALFFAFVPTFTSKTTLILHVAHSLFWSSFHIFGLGLLLSLQSKNKFLVRHFVKHYHYSPNDGAKGALVEAFANWKGVYNMSLVRTYGAGC